MNAGRLGQRRSRRRSIELRAVASLLRRFKRQCLVLLLLLISGGCTVSSTRASSAEERPAERRGHAWPSTPAAREAVVVRQAFDRITTRSALRQPI
ncbi:hypothetical protein [Burkholderia gladioli]|uniref:hypothetical protein n=1 Tax=Burkholderia gladioli TaxID=28095 RepID=UPI0011B1E940|nr:hypothetical protein [Burkholderia gladioli]MBU9170356.1 hypothetical protein [Burkholderia gladioli]MBU9177354.1 hypothetical protein [Burkholderia gladioli]MBU9384500.1 hypothetical protein [Burkholderia gladioli]MDN7806391.1 hypothetical protein [Burkholderia gladioli]